MTRTDWYAYGFDNYGNARLEKDPLRSNCAFEERENPIKFIQGSQTSYMPDNEIMFRHGISSKSFLGISCETSALRQELLDKYRAAGVSEINGIPIDKFVQVAQKIGKDSARGLSGLSHYRP